VAISLDEGLKRAQALAKRGETQQARQMFQALLEYDPGHRQARDELAALDHRSAQFNALAELYQKGDYEAAFQQGTVLVRQYPDAAFLYNTLGNTSVALGKWDEAIQCYSRALHIRPDVAETHVNLGKTFSHLARQEEAVACFYNALRVRPGYADAHYSLGVVFQALERDEEAVASYRKAVEINPNFTEAYDNMGIVLRRMGRIDEAIACFNRVLASRPENPGTLVQLGISLGKLGRFPESNAAFAAALAIRPSFSDPYAQKLYQGALICDWHGLAAEREAISTLGIDGAAVRPFVLFPLEDEPARHRARAERFTAERFAIPELAPIARPSTKPDRIRIGYFSANFHNHAVMHLMGKLLEAHDRSQFQIHLYSYGPSANDAERIRAQKAADIFHDVHALSGKEIAELARNDGIDIAIDLMGYTENARSEIFAHRAAPIQINYLGYPSTMGAPFMEYLIADRMLIPEGQEKHYSEQIIYLPHTFMPSDNGRDISDRAMTRREMGLPEKGVVFCCFNNSYKIGADEFTIWMRLLGKVEGSVLWLSGANDYARHNLRNAAEARGIDADRIVFTARLPMAEHLARHRLADLFLDTFLYNAHSTASDALWSGLPVITWPGRGFAARVGASLLRAIGLPELITGSAEEYERLALELATDPDKLAALKAKLARLRMSAPLFDTERFARHIEDGYTQAYQRYFEGKGPTHLTVSDYK